MHPYKKQIEACEQLIYYCSKNKKKEDAGKASLKEDGTDTTLRKINAEK